MPANASTGGSDLLLPAGSRLLHIGPPKTGTTAIQGAFRQARPVLADHGVVYPGTDRQHSAGARALLGSPGPKGDPPVDPRSWKRLVRLVTAAGDARVVVSSEVLSGAGEAAIRTIIEAFDSSRIHVVVTLRPLVKILPSAWQQHVRQTLRLSYEDWLRFILGPETAVTRIFWCRQHHDRLVERWASAVGAENLTVVVPDDSDRDMLMRVFEQLLGLPAGLLKPEWLTNPSLSYGEVEIVRHLNQEFADRGWPAQRHRALIRRGVVRQLLKTAGPVPEGQRIRIPPWAAERAAEIGRSAAERIAASGVRIVGDVTTLGTLPDPDEPGTATQAVVTSETATQAVLAGILAAMPKSSTAGKGAPADASPDGSPDAADPVQTNNGHAPERARKKKRRRRGEKASVTGRESPARQKRR